MKDYCIVSPLISRNGVKPMTPRKGSTLQAMATNDGYTHAVKRPQSRQEATIERDRAIIAECQKGDYVAYATTKSGRYLVGIVRKVENAVMYRKATTKGLGAWHVLQGYTKRMPEKEARRVFDIPSYKGYYLVDVRHIYKVTAREDTRETLQAAPHDRRPQEYIMRAKYPKHK